MNPFARMFAGAAPVHSAQPFSPGHDGRFHLLEARRGRGKSYGMTYWTYLWLVDRLPAILAGDAPHSRALLNFAIDPHRMALLLCTEGHMPSLDDALDLVHERVRYVSNWEEFFTAYDSLCAMDEANRSLDAYQTKRTALSALAHDWHQQSRKHKNTLLYATQYVDWINTQTRKLFDLLWRAKVVRHKSQRGPDGLKTPIRFNYYGSDPYGNGVDAQVVRRADFKMTLPFRLDVARAYRSWEPIVTFDAEQGVPWRSFRELSAWMTSEGRKPIPAPPVRDRLSILRDIEAGRISLDGAGDAGAGLVPVTAGAAPAARFLADVFDPSTLAVGFPKGLL